MKDLFICYAGQRRSRLAAEIATNLAEDCGIKDYRADHGGMNKINQYFDNYPSLCHLSIKEREFFGFPQSEPLDFDKYDRIFVMEKQFREELVKKYEVPTRKILNLDVEDLTGDDLRKMSESMLMERIHSELEEKLKPYFRRQNAN